ncbi:hypothetical protein G436_3363 [Leptospira interrogans serovar Hardjo str. Norma]|uniref:Uncharacterized protein n=1 Tax=Leptospira interrogans serovar Hardjo str. Norma TaxID=1279460 RepID=A0A0M4NAN5_LEPIR|nr:hypothetical protein G436_3363 [Leptospira interrogans serovar Hardjo str. Norma]
MRYNTCGLAFTGHGILSVKLWVVTTPMFGKRGTPVNI